MSQDIAIVLATLVEAAAQIYTAPRNDIESNAYPKQSAKQAATQACGENTDMIVPVYLMLYASLTEARDWAIYIREQALTMAKQRNR